MFPFFKPSRIEHPVLGPLERRRGYWRGHLRLDQADRPSAEAQPVGDVPLVLSGTRSGPHENALIEALATSHRFAGWRGAIAEALWEHYEPYREAVAQGELPPLPFDPQTIASAEQLLRHARLNQVAIEPLDGQMTVELCYETDWDVEHTLGLRFQRNAFVGLCGSILAR